MKTILACIFVLALSVIAVHGQTRNPVQTARSKGENRVNGRVDGTIDKGLDKIDEGIDGLFRKKNKKQKESGGTPQQPSSSSSTTNPADGPTDFSEYRRFDFIPGDKVIYFEDFAGKASGVPPARWNFSGSGEVATLPGYQENWLRLTSDGTFCPNDLKTLPDNFTLEMDIAATSLSYDLGILFVDAKFPDPVTSGWDNCVEIILSPRSQIPEKGVSRMAIKDVSGGTRLSDEFFYTEWTDPAAPRARVSMTRNNQRLIVYLNQTKIWDIPNAFAAGVKYRFAGTMGSYFVRNTELFVTNIRFATNTSQPAALRTQRRFYTTAIYFDVNSARIKPFSFSVLKSIAEELKNTSGTVKVVGHTDSDGNDEANLQLSRQRAEAVRQAFVREFNIDASRLITDGKGETAPVADNNTVQGKANNRRVEFILQ